MGIIGGLARGVHADDPRWTLPAFLAAAVWAWLGQRHPARVWMPQNRRQVTEAVRGYGPTRGAAQFGFEMGTGVRTHMTAASPYILAAWITLFAPWIHLAAAAVGFGIGRALPNFVYLRTGNRARIGIARVALSCDIIATLSLIALAIHVV